MISDVDSALAQLADAGFDIAHSFDAAAGSREPGWDALATGPRLGILVGNTRALWPRFVAAMRDPELAAEADPLERYVERTLETAFPGAQIFYGHRRYDDRFLPLQRLAVATGLGTRAPSQLVIHPIFGPWFALRAVIVVDGSGPERFPIAAPCTCEAQCSDALNVALASTGPTAWRAWVEVRSSCTLRAWRYGDHQLRYHYTKVWSPPGEGSDSP